MKRKWANLALEWGLSAEESDISLLSLRIFQLLDDGSTFTSESVQKRIVEALFISLSNSPLQTDNKKQYDVPTKSQLLYEILTSLLKKVSPDPFQSFF